MHMTCSHCWIHLLDVNWYYMSTQTIVFDKMHFMQALELWINKFMFSAMAAQIALIVALIELLK